MTAPPSDAMGEDFESVFDEFIDNPIINDRVLAAADLIAQDGDGIHYSLLLHAIVDDLNLEDHWFELDAKRRQVYGEVSDHERAVFDALAALTERERVTAVGVESGYLSRDGSRRHE